MLLLFFYREEARDMFYHAYRAYMVSSDFGIVTHPLSMLLLISIMKDYICLKCAMYYSAGTDELCYNITKGSE
jgi:hypothetical protein